MGHFTTRMNITFFITHGVLSTFLLSYVFKKSFKKKKNNEKPFLETRITFLGKRGILHLKCVTFFCHRLVVEYF